jgi:SAM-dependent methyltransferase
MTQPIPEGFHTLTPCLVVEDGLAALDFYERAFGAQVVRKLVMGGKLMHSELRIGDSLFSVSDPFEAFGLAAPAPGERYLNLACGSGTLLVERLALGPVRWALGCDLDAQVLACARANLAAADLIGRARLIQADAGRLPLPDAACDAITADLPFGQLVGSHAENEQLYPRLLAEATRVAAPGARLVLITHEIRLLDRLLAEPALAAAWRRAETIRVTLPFGAGGLNQRIFVLHRRSAGDAAPDGND